MNSKTTAAIIAGAILIMALIGFNLMKNPGVPSFDSAGARVCLDCHRSPNINTNEGVAASQAFCYDCHREAACVRNVDGTPVPLQVLPETFKSNQKPHQFNACIHCHTDVARSPHKTMTGATCVDCHSVHGEGTAGDPHLRVSCQACHFKSPFVAHDLKNDRIVLAHQDLAAKPISLADHALADVSDPKSCEKCHHAANPVGAPAVVLPS
ncbi:MAG TPA: hypothetical protein VLP30_03575, partial [Desulfatirhabdiaceae bacterium]|nr:hypothetical protein [Desulfatirhabdiaceae bacterium]